MKKFICVSLLVSGFIYGNVVESLDWGYNSAKDNGPNNWGNIKDAYILCKTGNMQSPINISSKSAKGHADNVKINSVNVKDAHVLNAVSTIRIENVSQNTLTFNNEKYELQQFHFHTPSEHKIDSKNALMEIHFLYESKDHKTLVVSTLVQEGKQNSLLKYISDNIPTANKTIDVHDIDISKIMPENKDSFEYKGSLTTPPCSQDVQWIVLKNPITHSADGIEAFHKVMNDNNRPLQNLNYREIN